MPMEKRLPRITLRFPRGAAMKRVLVIDDDRSIGEAIQTMLARYGYDTALALNSGDGIQLFNSSSFGVVIVDIFMPGPDGFETIKSLRQRSPSIPIIAMSGYGLRKSMTAPQDFLTMAIELGATSCLRKPFTFQQLKMAINSSHDQALPDHSTAT
jgi:CheY-like chemotaxis protein